VFDGVFNVADGELATRAARRCEQSHFVVREVAIDDEPAGERADLSGGTEDANARRHYATSNLKASCSFTTASSTWSWRTTHEMRMAEVEIISMLMSLAACVSNMVAATP